MIGQRSLPSASVINPAQSHVTPVIVGAPLVQVTSKVVDTVPPSDTVIVLGLAPLTVQLAARPLSCTL